MILNHIDKKLTVERFFTQFSIGKSLVFLINDVVNYMTFAHLARQNGRTRGKNVNCVQIKGSQWLSAWSKTH